MQQQFQGDLDLFKRALPGSSSRYSAMRKEREISPWGGNEQPRRTFNPSNYYHNFTKQLRDTKRKKLNDSSPLPHSKKGFIQRAKNVSLLDENLYKMSLVTVDLDDEAVNSDRRQSRTLEPLRRQEGKEQPVRVQIFKKILQKNQQAQYEYSDRMAEFIKEYHVQGLSNPFESFGSIDSGHVYQSMPKRSTRISYQRQRGQLQDSRHGYLPRISIEKQKSSKQQSQDFLCKGQLITSQKQVQLMKKMTFRSTQLGAKGQRVGEGVFFLKKYACQP